jgi:hypothetical protein
MKVTQLSREVGMASSWEELQVDFEQKLQIVFLVFHLKLQCFIEEVSRNHLKLKLN